MFVRYLIQFFLVFIIWQTGEWISGLLPFTFPGSLIGMMLLFTGLLSGIIKLEWIEDCSQLFLKYMAFFFVPAGVGLMVVKDIISANFIPLIVIIPFTTLLVMAVTGKITEKFMKGDYDHD